MQIDVAGQLLGLGAQSWVHPGGQAEEEGCRVGWAEPGACSRHRARAAGFHCKEDAQLHTGGETGFQGARWAGQGNAQVISAASSNEPLLLYNLTQH